MSKAESAYMSYLRARGSAITSTHYTASPPIREASIREASEQELQADAPQSLEDSGAQAHDARDDVDWQVRDLPPSGPGRLFAVLAGPEPTIYETLITAFALLGTCYVAHTSALPVSSEAVVQHSWLSSTYHWWTSAPTWSRTQYYMAMFLAAIDGSAAVQTSTAHSKRWYHSGGRLPMKLAAVIMLEAVAQSVLIGYLFASPVHVWPFSLRAGAYFVGASLALLVAPLHVQRPTSVLLLMAAFMLDQHERLLPPTPGIEWARVVLPIKYVLSHPVRHEPYRSAAL